MASISEEPRAFLIRRTVGFREATPEGEEVLMNVPVHRTQRGQKGSPHESDQLRDERSSPGEGQIDLTGQGDLHLSRHLGPGSEARTLEMGYDALLQTGRESSIQSDHVGQEDCRREPSEHLGGLAKPVKLQIGMGLRLKACLNPGEWIGKLFDRKGRRLDRSSDRRGHWRRFGD